MKFSLKDLLQIEDNMCKICGEEFPITGSICETCENKLLYPEENLVTYVDYVSPIAVSLKYNEFIKNTIWNFKFKDKTHLYKPLGDIMIKTLISTKLYRDIDLVTAVPMAKRDQAFRGYNQSALLAEYISSELNLKYHEHIIRKVRSGKKQIDMDYTRRWDNVKNAFKSTDLKAFENTNILIVDDILTSGATFSACGKTLIDSGANTIRGLALATPSLL